MALWRQRWEVPLLVTNSKFTHFLTLIIKSKNQVRTCGMPLQTFFFRFAFSLKQKKKSYRADVNMLLAGCQAVT